MRFINKRQRTFDNRNQYGYQLDGFNEFFDISAMITPLSSNTTGVLSAWVKPTDATPLINSAILSFSTANDVNRLTFVMSSTGTLICFLKFNGVNQFLVETTGAVFSDNTWTHVAAVQDGVEVKLYVNKVFVPQAFSVFTDKTKWFSTFTAGNALTIGRIGSLNNGVEGNFLQATIDVVSFFNSNMTAAEEAELYNGGKPKNLKAHSKAGNLIGYFPLGEPTDSFSTNWTILDHSVSAANGVSANMEQADLVAGILGSGI